MPSDPRLPAAPGDLSLEVRLAMAQAEADRYRTLVEDLKEVVFRIDREGHWSFLNPAWTELTGIPVAETADPVAMSALAAANNGKLLAVHERHKPVGAIALTAKVLTTP